MPGNDSEPSELPQTPAFDQAPKISAPRIGKQWSTKGLPTSPLNSRSSAQERYERSAPEGATPGSDYNPRHTVSISRQSERTSPRRMCLKYDARKENNEQPARLSVLQKQKRGKIFARRGRGEKPRKDEGHKSRHVWEGSSEPETRKKLTNHTNPPPSTLPTTSHTHAPPPRPTHQTGTRTAPRPAIPLTQPRTYTARTQRFPTIPPHTLTKRSQGLVMRNRKVAGNAANKGFSC
ncbi:hypothetical protein BDW02DRAFT_622675 [Decorospora gaudefroyi]|uniref:Uncharacterized protein n=1 Tax=Decorospora gaudefroyi TaxID=184978 RepID=A0A6A5KBP7_9PLEO|nr:hypothetical protein BDW02DRAFT_622675 [Decorospora gaudefroyi]